MILYGQLIDAGDLPEGRGVRLQRRDGQQFAIVGLEEDQTKLLARMMFQIIEVSFAPMHGQDDSVPEPPSRSLVSNIDEQTGIRKHGEI